ncbi:MAG: SoxR reducing system RseC family protein [Zoogloeaceae bacterium]|jgi:sigma-E factor negative regulatory protein RseC|nr:SoxR reducing system RseC family protein [Zoogloeaceae bacterium]
MMPIDILHGTVLTIHDGKATVRLNAPVSACGACAHGNSCGIGRLSTPGNASDKTGAKQNRGVQLNLDVPPGIHPGDQVNLLAPRTSLPALALLGYVFPALAMLLGAALGQSLYGSDGIAALFSLCTFLLALVLVQFVSARHSSLCSLSLAPLSHTEFPHEH